VRAAAAARTAFIDELIAPEETRGRLAWALATLVCSGDGMGKGNIPL
jgi:hypothetical protein